MITVKKNAIKYKSSDGTVKDSGVLCNVGTFGVDNIQYASGVTFRNTKFPEGYELVVNIPNLSLNGSGIIDMLVSFADTSGIEKVKLIGNPNNARMNTGQMFTRSTVKIIDFTEFKIIAASAITSMFNSASQLEEILGEMDFSGSTSFGSAFRTTPSLREIRVAKGCIKASVDFASSSLLSDASIDSLVNGFADMTGQTAIVFTVHKDAKAKIEANPVWLATLTSKNVTLA